MTASSSECALAFVAGVSVGPFRLLAPLVEVVQLLRNAPETYGHVEVEHKDEGHDLALFLPKYKVRLVFDNVAQHLNRIVVVNLPTAGDFLYRGRVFSSGHFPATLAHVYDVVGPTFQGEVVGGEHYQLQYPGMRVLFAIPQQYAHLFSEKDAHPTTLPNGAAPLATQLVVELPAERKVPSPLPVVQSGDSVAVAVGGGVEFRRMGERLAFGSCPQDAISMLGMPASVFLKDDDRMQVHGGELRSAVNLVRSDYFFNYPLLGLDLLYSGLSHGLTKIVLHNPFPVHQSFLQVHRCNFSCVLPVTFWKPSTVLDNKTNWNWLQGQYKGELPKPLLSSTGCLNGAVMRLFCLHGIVIYVLPNGSIPQIIVFCLPETALGVGHNTAGVNRELVRDDATTADDRSSLDEVHDGTTGTQQPLASRGPLDGDEPPPSVGEDRDDQAGDAAAPGGGAAGEGEEADPVILPAAGHDFQEQRDVVWPSLGDAWRAPRDEHRRRTTTPASESPETVSPLPEEGEQVSPPPEESEEGAAPQPPAERRRRRKR